MARALIVVDVQNDFCEGGSLAVEGGAAVAAGVGRLLARWQTTDPTERDYSYVLATRDHHIDPGEHFSDRPDFVHSWPRHCVVGTSGADFHPALTPRPFDAVFDKGEYAAAYSGFEGRADGVALERWLRAHQVEAVDVCGIATDYCVRATALDAATGGFDTRVLTDLCVGVAPESTSETLTTLAEFGIFLA